MIHSCCIDRFSRGVSVVKLLVAVFVLAVAVVGGLALYSVITQTAQTKTVSESLSDAAQKINDYKSKSSINAYPSTLKKAGVSDVDGVTYTYTGSNSAYCLVGAGSDDIVYAVSSKLATPEEGDCGDLTVSTDEGCFETESVDGGVEISAYRGGGGSFYAENSKTSCSGDIDIPFTISGQQVVGIGEAAFSSLYEGWSDGDFSITSISIPDSVTYIGMSAFSSNNLTSVAIPSSVKTIGSYAFQGDALTTVTFSDGLTSIGRSAFQYNSIALVTIPATVTSIENYAFSGNSSIECDFLGSNTFKDASTGCYGESS